jgi:protein involved in polysaccharide export with SLBB domain
MIQVKNRMTWLLVVLLAFGHSSRAQQNPSTPTTPPTKQNSAYTATTRQNTYELEKENSEHVAASVEQIRVVLIKDPGLLVELKHLVAKEATANGQLVDDRDLSDQAILDRLSEDITFRSTATQLLQRYGYLLPNINPDSALAKQEDLVLKERARRLVQVEAQEDAEAMKPKEQPPQGVQQTSSCDPQRNLDCRENTQRRSRQRSLDMDDIPGTRQDQQQNVPNNLPPSPNTLPLMRAGMMGGGRSGLSSMVRSSGDGSDSIQLAAMAGMLRQPSSSLDMESLASALRGNSSNFDATSMGGLGSNSRNDSMLASANGRSRTNSLGQRDPLDMPRPEVNREPLQGAIVHKANPYADVPSLYDMYVQVSTHDKPLERFGVSILNDGDRELDVMPMDLPVGPDYVVGPGDGLAIDLWGGVSQRMVRVVDREGRISLPEAGPMLVSGKTLGDVQATVQQTLRMEYRDISADVSLSKLRTVRVYVVGEVLEPGAYDISSLSTPLNALVAAGGITTHGSLRLLKHYRGKQLIEVVDAYDLLLRGVVSDQKRLENGDSLLVPAVGAQVTVEGMVRRPAVYELQGKTSLEDALELAGGILPAASLQHVEVERLVAHQNRTMFSLDLSEKEGTEAAASKLSNFEVQDGDKIHIFPIAPYNDKAIYLQGHVLRPGRYSYHDGMTVTEIISSYSDLLPEPAGKYAEIIRLNAPDFRPTVESFDLTAALANPANAPKLQPLDTVRIFSKYDFEPAPQVWVGGEVRTPGQYNTSGQAHLRDAIYLAGGISADASLDSAQLFRTGKNGKMTILSVNLGEALAGKPDDNLVLEPHDRIIVHRNAAKVDPATVYVKGEVAKPGRYPLTSNMRVEDLIRVAGGMKSSADTQSAILAHGDVKESASATPGSMPINIAAAMKGEASANPPLNNGDVLTIRKIPGWSDLGSAVTIRGEVQHPGTYGIRPGESLSAVLEKAGGFTEQAYPYGTVLTRREVRELEMKAHEELVARIKVEAMQLKTLPENDADQKNAKLTAIAQADTTLTQLEANPPVGRVVIQTSSNLKSFEQAAETTPLRSGDVITVPKKANYVLVNGQVFNSTAVGYVPGRSANWYLTQAGGLTQLADKKAVFVIHANGSVLAAKNNSGMWSGDPMNAVLMPGDSIVVPEKAARVGSRNWTPLIQTAQVATSIAIAVAYLKP